MKLSKAAKGIILAVSAAFAVSNVYIFSKAALNEIHIAQFGFYWFGLGIFWNLIYIFVFKKYKLIGDIKRKTWGALMLIATLEMFGTVFFFLAMKQVENPTVVSFLANINPLLVTSLGVLILSERFNRYEFTGMIITLFGAFMISFNSNSTLNNLFIPGTEYVWLSGIIYAFSNVIAKKNIHLLDASFMALSRILFLFSLSLIAMLTLKLPFVIPATALKNVAIGSVLGPFFTAVLGYLSLKYIEVSKASIVRTVRSLFVLAGAYLYFGIFPTQVQIIGGLFTMAGVILISFGKLRMNYQIRKAVRNSGKN